MRKTEFCYFHFFFGFFGPITNIMEFRNIYNLFSTLGPKRRRNCSVRIIAIVFVYHNLIKKHGLQKSLGGEHITPGPWTIIYRKDTLTFAAGIQNMFLVEVSNRNYAHCVFCIPRLCLGHKKHIGHNSHI